MELNSKEISLKEALTDDGAKQVFDNLMYGSYRANRDEGMTHEQLIRFGIGNDGMRAMYELEQLNNSN